jgi:hypothetical protein
VNALANNINGKFSFQFYIEKRGAHYDFSEYNPNSITLEENHNFFVRC